MDVNDQSLVGILSIDTLDMLFTGDVGTGVEYELVTSGLLPQVEVVKMPHHGSNTSSSVEFISLTRPEWVLVGVGEGNRFGHPVPEVLDRWEAMGSRVARTDTEGSVRLVYSEGKLVREK